MANQSLNVAINYSNANKATPLSTATIAKSYFLAVSASCGVAYGLNATVPRLKRLSPNAKLIAGRLVPFAAVAFAGVLNVFLMRGEEIKHGIPVFPVLTDEEKKRVDSGEMEYKPLGKSKKAATIAVGETAVSRVLNATPPPPSSVEMSSAQQTLPALTALVSSIVTARLPALRGRRYWARRSTPTRVGNRAALRSPSSVASTRVVGQPR